MVTIKDCVDAYLRRRGMFRIKGSDEDVSLLLPMIVMNSAYMVYIEHIKPVESRHEMKKYKKEWVRQYNAFNHNFYSAWSSEQCLYMYDMTERFDKYIEHDILVAFVQLTNIFKDEPFDKQKVLSACLLVNVLTQSAEIIYERLFEACAEKKDKNLLSCRWNLAKFANAFYGNNRPDLNPNTNKNVCDAVDVLCKKQLKFLKMINDEETNSRG